MKPREPIDSSVAAASRGSAWAPLREREFRLLWLGAFFLYLAVWMQNVGAAWLMATLAPSPLMVALVQAATSLPAFVFSLLGGLLADRLERRPYLLAIHAWMLGAAALLCFLTLRQEIGPWCLFAITFAFGCGYALQAPAWHATQLNAVPKELLPGAVTLASIPYNVARSLGPAVAGVVIAAHGPSIVFLAVTAGLGAVLTLLLAWRGGERRAGEQQGAGPLPGLTDDLREVMGYIGQSRPCRVQLLRTAIFVGSSSGLMALLPVLVRDRVAAGATIYGGLLAASAIGAVLGALILPGLLRRGGRDAVALGAIGVFAVATLGAVFVRQVPILCGLMFAAGAAWLMVVNIELGAMQGAVPDRLRARAVAVFLLVYQGAQATGSVFWGSLADRWGLAWTLAGEALALLGTLLVIQRLGREGADSSGDS